MAVAITPAELVTALAKNGIQVTREQAECALVDVILAHPSAEQLPVREPLTARETELVRKALNATAGGYQYSTVVERREMGDLVRHKFRVGATISREPLCTACGNPIGDICWRCA